MLETKLTLEQQKLVKDHVWLAKTIARAECTVIANSAIYVDLCVAQAFWGLVEAAQRYRAYNNASFQTYSRKVIKGRVWDLVRGPMAPSRSIALRDKETSDIDDEIAGGGDPQETKRWHLVVDVRPNPYRLALQKQLVTHILEISDRLDRQQKEVIQSLYLRDEDRNEVADRLGVPVYKVDRLKEKAVGQIQEVVWRGFKKAAGAFNQQAA